jgi:TetR/AcrR family transcriptional repressor of nem operon
LIWTRSYGATSVDAIATSHGSKKEVSITFLPQNPNSPSRQSMRIERKEATSSMRSFFADASLPALHITSIMSLSASPPCGVNASGGRCPLFTLGCEVSTQTKRSEKSARDSAPLHTVFRVSDPRSSRRGRHCRAKADRKARLLFAFVQGSLTEARIHNDLQILRGMKAGALELLGHQRVAS